MSDWLSCAEQGLPPVAASHAHAFTTFRQPLCPCTHHNTPPHTRTQYPRRLTATSWDLAYCRSVVGFSGTCDNHRLLPRAVSQSVPGRAAELRATDGCMLDLLLRTQHPYTSLQLRVGGKGSSRRAMAQMQCACVSGADAAGAGGSASSTSKSMVCDAVMKAMHPAGLQNMIHTPAVSVHWQACPVTCLCELALMRVCLHLTRLAGRAAAVACGA